MTMNSIAHTCMFAGVDIAMLFTAKLARTRTLLERMEVKNILLPLNAYCKNNPLLHSLDLSPFILSCPNISFPSAQLHTFHQYTFLSNPEEDKGFDDM